MFRKSTRRDENVPQSKPVTLFGTLFLHTLLRQQEERERYRKEFAERAPREGFEQLQVATLTFNSFVRRHFPEKPSDEQANSFIDEMYEGVPSDLIPHRDATPAVVQAAFEDSRGPVAGLSEPDSVSVRTHIASLMVRRLGYTEDYVCQSIVDAEKELIGEGVPLVRL